MRHRGVQEGVPNAWMGDKGISRGGSGTERNGTFVRSAGTPGRRSSTVEGTELGQQGTFSELLTKAGFAVGKESWRGTQVGGVGVPPCHSGRCRRGKMQLCPPVPLSRSLPFSKRQFPPLAKVEWARFLSSLLLPTFSDISD